MMKKTVIFQTTPLKKAEKALLKSKHFKIDVKVMLGKVSEGLGAFVSHLGTYRGD